MQKITSLFQRNYDGDRLVRDEVVPGSEWVLAGEGVATRKWDGTCCMVQNGKLFKRYDAKKGKTPPEGFIPAQEPDEKTGHWPGWLPVGDGPEDQYHREGHYHLLCGQACKVCSNPPDETGCIEHGRGCYTQSDDGGGESYEDLSVLDGTYELVGPKSQGNPEGIAEHRLIRHGEEVLKDAPRDFEGIKAYLASGKIEGIVWHHPGGRMVKIKAKDFGIKRGAM